MHTQCVMFVHTFVGSARVRLDTLLSLSSASSDGEFDLKYDLLYGGMATGSITARLKLVYGDKPAFVPSSTPKSTKDVADK